ncbi:MAG: MBL fold metallo-hydrolase [Desulfobaccales bacterium]
MPETVSYQVPAGSKVRIRMYRQGLGDCFLLTFYDNNGPNHILIDCGVLLGTPNGSQKILQVAQDIATETNGKLKALVATHEHWDHISGFFDAAEVFDPFDIGEIWVAWTEDPSNPTAKSLKRQNSLKLQAIHLALAQLAETGEPQFQAYGQGVAGLLAFFGGPAAGATLAAFSDKTSQAMAKVTQRHPVPTYCKPGDVIRRDWLPGVGIYVMGPPEDPAMLHLMEGPVGKDMYGLTGADSAFAAALEASALAAMGEEADPISAGLIDAALPFNASLQWHDKPGKNRILEDPQFGPLYKSYMADDASWRRIDQDWLLSMARLGLQLDNATNNTSLVLAFEFSDTKEVLLFAADAQIGNWKSWFTIKAFDAADLMRRTVFYKVGHHGSHNATLKEGGLEAMTTPGLVAAIPVDENFANNVKHWPMPAKPLYARLQDLTRGRILRADKTWPSDADQPPPGLSTEDWRDFTGMVQLAPDGLFIDFYMK